MRTKPRDPPMTVLALAVLACLTACDDGPVDDDHPNEHIQADEALDEPDDFQASKPDEAEPDGGEPDEGAPELARIEWSDPVPSTGTERELTRLPALLVSNATSAGLDVQVRWYASGGLREDLRLPAEWISGDDVRSVEHVDGVELLERVPVQRPVVVRGTAYVQASDGTRQTVISEPIYLLRTHQGGAVVAFSEDHMMHVVGPALARAHLPERAVVDGPVAGFVDAADVVVTYPAGYRPTDEGSHLRASEPTETSHE